MNKIKIFKFKQPLNIPIQGEDRTYELIEDYECFWDEGGIFYRLLIPKGAKNDGASVPRLLWTFSDLTPDGVVRGAATVHDRIYEKQGRMGSELFTASGRKWLPSSRRLTRKDADKLFLALMKVGGVNKTTRRRAYWAVRIFGYFAWKK